MGFFDFLKPKADQTEGQAAKNPLEMLTAGLDKTKQALNLLKRNVETQKADQSLDEIKNGVKAAFQIDMVELGITDATEQEARWQQIEQQIQKYIEALQQKKVLESPEFADLQSFTGNLENMAGLKEIIADKDPTAKARGWLEGLKDKPVIGGLVAYMGSFLMEWANDLETDKDGKKKLTAKPLADALRKVAAWFGVEAATQETQVAAQTAQPEAPKAPEQKEAELSEEAKKLVDQFKAANVELINTTADEQLKQLKTLYPDKFSEVIANSLKANSKMNEILRAAQSYLGLASLPKAHLLYVRFDRFNQQTNIDAILKTLKGDADAPYTIEKTDEAVAEFLLAAQAMEAKPEEVKKFEKPNA